MVTRSLVVIAHRPGNPKKIADWSDLARPGVAVLYPDPKTSGGARWNINAIYGAGLLSKSPDDPEAARALLASIQANVVNMDSSGRQSMATFSRGTGDAVVSYENEIILQGKVRGEAVPYVVPPATLQIEGPAAVVDASVDRHGNRALAEAFLAFMRSPKGQLILVDYGFRPLDRALDVDSRRPPLPPRLFTMKALGGWKGAKKVIYAPGGRVGLDLHRSVEGRAREGGGAMRMRKPNASPIDLLVRGATLSYLGVMVVLPLFVLGVEAAKPGGSAFTKALVDPFAWHALKLTFATAGAMVVVNALMGTATAWVLVRYPFPGKGIVNALIDLPFAVPTVVTGLMLVVLYGPNSTLGVILGRYGLDVVYQKPGIVLALMFVTYPFVIRSVQPVLLEMDRAEEEAAATLGASGWTTFRRVTLPTLWPAIVTGTALSFSRALGEFGSVVMVAGNRPLETKTAPMFIFGEVESGRQHNAMVVSAVLLASSLGILVALNLLQRRGGQSHGP